MISVVNINIQIRKTPQLRGFLFVILLIFSACITEPKQEVKLVGETMGTTYVVKYITDEEPPINNVAIKQLLNQINESVSTYIKRSTISRINVNNVTLAYAAELDTIFIENFNLSKKIYKQTKGAFNPSLMPLVNYWGFGYKEKSRTEVDSALVDKMIKKCNLDYFKIEDNRLRKGYNEGELDFSAIAKGYAVDEIGALLESRKINNYMIEIGGEILAKGKNAADVYWAIAVDQPKIEGKRKNFKAIINLNNKAIATSGNYRNYREIGKEKYGHIIDPATGYPKQTDILSVSIIADNCASADAFATACMVMGAQKAKDYIELNLEIEGYLIYLDENGKEKSWKSDGIEIRELGVN